MKFDNMLTRMLVTSQTKVSAKLCSIESRNHAQQAPFGKANWGRGIVVAPSGHTICLEDFGMVPAVEQQPGGLSMGQNRVKEASGRQPNHELNSMKSLPQSLSLDVSVAKKIGGLNGRSQKS
jgi:hypothetical protein